MPGFVEESSTHGCANDDSSWCRMDDNIFDIFDPRDDIYVSYSHEEPLSWKEAMWQPFLSCGLCQQDIEDDAQLEKKTSKEEEHVDTDWPTLIWALSGFEFIRLSCTDPAVMDSVINDKIVVTSMVPMG